MLEKIANLQWYWVLIIAAILMGIRFSLKNTKNVVGKQVAELSESLAIAAVLVFLIIRPFIVQAFFIPSGSMRMGLLEQDHILVNKFLYRVVREPKHGDVIVFKAPPNASMDGKEHDFIKRLIGEPGDTLKITQGYVMVGDIKLLHSDLRELLVDKAPRDKYDIRAKIVKDGVLMNGHKVSAKEIAAAVGERGAKVTFHPGLVYRNGKALSEPYTAEDSEFEFPETKVPEGQYFMLGDNRNMSRDSRFWGALERKRVMGKPLFRFFPLTRMGLVD